MQIERFRGVHPVYFRPIFGMRGLSGDMTRLFPEFVNEAASEGSVAFGPVMDFVDTGEALQVKVELPGVTKEGVEISLKDDQLTIKGEKKEEREENTDTRYFVERTYGTFSRTLTLPSLVKSDQVKAIFENGVLVITLPKDEEEKVREVQVNVD
jgi:HSP20 family protein